MNVTQHRTQVYLDDERYRWLKVQAVEKNTTLARAVRDVVDTVRTIQQKAGQKKKKLTYQALQKLIGIGKKGPRDVSARHDYYLGNALFEDIVRNRR